MQVHHEYQGEQLNIEPGTGKAALFTYYKAFADRISSMEQSLGVGHTANHFHCHLIVELW